MNRRSLLKNSAALGFAAALPTMTATQLFASAGTGQMESGKTNPTAKSNPLALPAKGPIPVAFPISDGAEVIDFGDNQLDAQAGCPHSKFCNINQLSVAIVRYMFCESPLRHQAHINLDWHGRTAASATRRSCLFRFGMAAPGSGISCGKARLQDEFAGGQRRRT